MIQGRDCKEKLEASHSDGLKARRFQFSYLLFVVRMLAEQKRLAKERAREQRQQVSVNYFFRSYLWDHFLLHPIMVKVVGISPSLDWWCSAGLFS